MSLTEEYCSENLLVRQEKLRNDWKRIEGDREELQGLLLVHQSGINDNDYHVVIGMCGEDRSYENVWKSMKKIFGGRKEEGKIGRNSSWMREEVATKENPMGRYGNCLNCLLELNFVKRFGSQNK